MFDSKFLKKVFTLIYSEFGDDYTILDMETDASTYEEFYEFIGNSLGLEGEQDKIDFIYASYYLNLKEYGGNILSSIKLNDDDILIPTLKTFKGNRTYYATVQYDERYTMNTYLPSIMEYAINEYQIDEDEMRTDVLDTWDYDVNIQKQ